MTVRMTVFGGALSELLHLVIGQEVCGVTQYIVGKQIAIAELVVALTQRAFKLIQNRIRKLCHTQSTYETELTKSHSINLN